MDAARLAGEARGAPYARGSFTTLATASGVSLARERKYPHDQTRETAKHETDKRDATSRCVRPSA